MLETELKFLVDKKELRLLMTRLREKTSGQERPRWRMLRSVYYDTDDFALRRSGYALRLRREGRRWVQTVKIGSGPACGLSQSIESTCRVPRAEVNVGAIPDETVRNALAELVNQTPLAPVCETAIRRTTREVQLEDGSRVEIAVDVGEIHASDRCAEIREAEFELLEGSAQSLYDLAQQLLPDPALKFSRLSKAARGYLLAGEGRIEYALAPRNAKNIPLKRGQTAEQSAHAVLRECFDQISTNVAVVRAIDDPEGPHQLRVGLRRLRTAFGIFASALDSPGAERLKEEARWLGQAVGFVRDLDVISDEIIIPDSKANPSETGYAALVQAIGERAKTERTALRKTLCQERAQAFLFDLARFTETRGWLLTSDLEQTARLAEPVEVLAARALDSQYKRVRKKARNIAKLTVDQRHELRKELKKLRYASEFYGPLFPSKKAGRFAKRLKKMQELLGALNDIAMAEAVLIGPDAPCAKNPAAQRATGLIIGSRLARDETAWSGAADTWRAFQAEGPFWR